MNMGALGIRTTSKWRPRLLAAASQFLLGIAGLALITCVCFQLDFGVGRMAFAYLILIVSLSLLGSVSASVVLSIIATACLNFFFAPPLFELRVDAEDDAVRVAMFLTTSLIVTLLTTKRKRAEQALGETNARLEEAQRVAHVGWWDRDLITGRIAVSDGAVRILGMRPVAAWLELIHPEDRARVADASAAAVRPGVHATTWNTGCCVLMGPCESSTAGVKSLGTTRDGLCAPGLARRRFDAARESSRVGIDEHSSLLARASSLVGTLACRLSDRKAAFGGALAGRQCVGTYRYIRGELRS